MGEPLRVVVLEDEDLFRNLLTTSLAGFSEIQVVASYRDGTEALSQLERDRPDVAILDIDLGGGETGVQVGLRMRQVRPEIGIVLLSNYDAPGVLTALPRGDADGWSYLLKKSVAQVSTIVHAIQATHARLMVLDPHLANALRPREKSRLATLTPRQGDILRLMAQGYSNAGIAAELVIAVKSVENYVSQIYQALSIDAGVSSLHARVRATLIFLEESRR